ncbi:MAG: hypothetical protein ACQEWV_15145 [Bacillota bacterium]
MAKDQFEDSDFHLKGKINEEVLEISSTGYGLESVSKKNAEKLNFQEPKDTNSQHDMEDSI